VLFVAEIEEAPKSAPTDAMRCARNQHQLAGSIKVGIASSFTVPAVLH